jgi:dihydropteroate synthase
MITGDSLTWNHLLTVKPFLIFGILNVTPDSFSDGGAYQNLENIGEHITQLFGDGADVVDVGAESTRPGAVEVKSEVELKRLEPVFNLIDPQGGRNLFSIDTRHADTAQIAFENGFQIINDVSGANYDPKMREVMSECKSLVIVMHSRGTPQTMNSMSNYDDVVFDVTKELEQSCSKLVEAGVDPKKIMVDPGIGFAKTPEQGLKILDSLGQIKSDLGYPMLVGVSRKTVTSYVLTRDPQKVPYEQRDHVSAEIALRIREQGIDAIRVHNVAKTVELLQ